MPVSAVVSIVVSMLVVGEADALGVGSGDAPVGPPVLMLVDVSFVQPARTVWWRAARL